MVGFEPVMPVESSSERNGFGELIVKELRKKPCVRFSFVVPDRARGLKFCVRFRVPSAFVTMGSA